MYCFDIYWLAIVCNIMNKWSDPVCLHAIKSPHRAFFIISFSASLHSPFSPANTISSIFASLFGAADAGIPASCKWRYWHILIHSIKINYAKKKFAPISIKLALCCRLQTLRRLFKLSLRCCCWRWVVSEIFNHFFQIELESLPPRRGNLVCAADRRRRAIERSSGDFNALIRSIGYLQA